MIKFTVYTKVWLRGEGGHASCLLRDSDGKMCCIGQFALAVGTPRGMLQNQPSPASLLRKTVKKADIPAEMRELIFAGRNTNEVLDLMSCNDSVYERDGSFITREAFEADRRECLKAGFRRLGYEVEFSDDDPPAEYLEG